MKDKTRTKLTILVSMVLGALLFQLGFNLVPQFIKSFEPRQEIRNEQGAFACWYIDGIIESESYKNATDRVRDIVQIEKKYCVDIPKFNTEQRHSGLLMPSP